MTIQKDYSGGVSADSVVGLSLELSGHKEKMKSAQGRLRETRKRMEEGGIDLKSYDLAMKLSALDPYEAIERLNKAYFYLKAMHAPVGAQLGFHDMVNDNSLTEEQRLQKWYDEGHLAGSTGKWEKDCPHGVHLPAGQKWLEGYRDAQAKLASNFSPSEPVTEAATEKAPAAEAPKADAAPSKRRGRPPGSGKKGAEIVSQSGVKAVSSEIGAPPEPDDASAPPFPDPDEAIPFSDPPTPEVPPPPEPMFH